MKTKKTPNALGNEVEALNRKLVELTGDEPDQVVGGFDMKNMGFEDSDYDIVYKKDGDAAEDISKPGDYTATVGNSGSDL